MRLSDEERRDLLSEREKQNQYIEELLEGLKDRQAGIENLETDKEGLEGLLVEAKKDIEKVL